MSKEKPPEPPRQMQVELGLDWKHGALLLKEKAENGIQLLNPVTMAIPFEAVLMAAAQILPGYIQRGQQLQRDLQAATATKDGIIMKGPRREM